MILYHGTKFAILPKIKKEGIKPLQDNTQTGNWKHTIPSRIGHVYLTNAYPWYFAAHCTRIRSKALVLEIDIPEDMLYPDEDFIGQVLHRKEEYSDYDLLELTEAIDLEEYKHNWEDSLTHMGTCSYKGIIPWQYVKRYAVVSDWNFLFMCSDAQVSLINYKFVGYKYKELLKLSFKDIEEFVDPLFPEELREQLNIKPLRIDPTKHQVVNVK